MLDRLDVINKISKICIKYKDVFSLVILFGSVARDEIKNTSDIDLYVESDLTTNKLNTSKRFQNFSNELYENFIGTEFDIITCGGIRDKQAIKDTVLWCQIEKDGVVIYDKRAENV